jgi:hypothetical protein
MSAGTPRSNPAENGVADIFQEIDEELRQDRAAKLWDRYGNYVIAVAVLIVLSVGGYKFWVAHDLETRQAESSTYQEAVSRVGAGDVDGAISTLGDLARDAGSGYRVLARLQQAALAARQGDLEAAALAYGTVAADASAPEVLRDLARVRSVAARIETADPADLRPTLDAQAVAGKPWRPMAMELKGILALKAGDVAAAREIFAGLSDSADTPSGMRARAAEILKALGK